MQNKESIPLIPTPKQIFFMDKLPCLGGVPKEMSPSKLITECGMQSWTEGYEFDEKTLSIIKKSTITQLSKANKEQFKKIAQAVQSNLKKQAIVKMDNAVGYGVFALEDIPENSYLAFYTGPIVLDEIKNPNKEDSAYCYSVGESLDGQYLIQIDPKNHGNLGRFYQHLPNAKKTEQANTISFEDYQFVENKQNDIAVANCVLAGFQWNNSVVCVLKTIKLIKKGEIIGFDYGEYWLGNHKHPCLFYKDGTLVNDKDYQLQKWILRVTLNFPKYIDIVLTPELMKRFEHYPIITDQSDKEFTISPEDFKQAKQNTPEGSPYLFLPKPTSIQEIKPQNNIDIFNFLNLMKNLPKENIKKEVPKNATPVNPQETTVAIKNQLKRITGQNHLWGYSFDLKIAWLESDNQNTINEIFSHLQKYGFEVKKGVNSKSLNKNPLIHVKNPNLEILKETPVLNVQHNIVHEYNK